MLRARSAGDPKDSKIYAATFDRSPRLHEQKLAQGYDGTIAKPYRRDDVLGLLKSLGKLAPEAAG
jgi:hypothetical protein